MNESDKVILLVLTTSRQSPKTIELAINEAKAQSAKLHVLFMVESETPDNIFSRLTNTGFIGEKPSHEISSAIMDEYQKRAEAMIKEVEQMSEAAGLQVSSRLKGGDFVSCCMNEISVMAVNKVILTRKRRSSISRYLFGSPVDRLKKLSRCEVRVVEEG